MITNIEPFIPIVGIVLGACYITITMHASVVGTIRNSTESLKGGFNAFVVAYVSLPLCAFCFNLYDLVFFFFFKLQ